MELPSNENNSNISLLVGQDLEKGIGSQIRKGEDPRVALGRNFASDFIKDGKIPDNLAESLGEGAAENFKKLKKPSLVKVAEILSKEISKFSSGSDSDIYTLSKYPSDASNAVRKNDINTVLTLRSAFVELIEDGFRGGNLTEATEILDLYSAKRAFNDSQRLPEIVKEALRYYQPNDTNEANKVLKSLEKIVPTSEVYSPSLHDSISNTRSKLGITPNIPPEASPVQENIIIKNEPKEIPEIVSKEESKNNVLTQAAKSSFNDGGNLIKDIYENGGYPAIRLYGEDIELNNKFNLREGFKDYGIQNYLDLMMNLSNPENMDKYVKEIIKNTNMNTLGELRNNFTDTEWEQMIKDKIITEIQGNAIGIVLQTIDSNSQYLPDSERENVILNALKVFGQGKSSQMLFGEKGGSSVNNFFNETILNFKNKINTEKDSPNKHRKLSLIDKLEKFALKADEEFYLFLTKKETETIGNPTLSVPINNEKILDSDTQEKMAKESFQYSIEISELRQKVDDLNYAISAIQNIYEYNNPLAYVDVVIGKDQIVIKLRDEVSKEAESKRNYKRIDDSQASRATEMTNHVFSEFIKLVSEKIELVNDSKFIVPPENIGIFGSRKPKIKDDAFMNPSSIPNQEDIYWNDFKNDVDNYYDKILSWTNSNGEIIDLSTLQERAYYQFKLNKGTPEKSNETFEGLGVIKESLEGVYKELNTGINNRISKLAMDLVHRKLKEHMEQKGMLQYRNTTNY